MVDIAVIQNAASKSISAEAAMLLALVIHDGYKLFPSREERDQESSCVDFDHNRRGYRFIRT